jgi:general secretion pathway protein H
MRSRQTVPTDGDASSGFTLLELLVVVAILALLAALVPRLTRHSPGLTVRATATALAADLRALRTQATRRRQATELVLGDNAYMLSAGSVTRSISTDVSLSYTAPEPDLLGRPANRLKFFSDGSSSGGIITLRDGKSRAFVEVNWLNGAAFVHAQ